jgi:hypothetical protein
MPIGLWYVILAAVHFFIVCVVFIVSNGGKP